MTDEELSALRRELENWLKDSISVPGVSDPSLGDIITDEFIRENTDVEDLEAFLGEAPFNRDAGDLIGPEMDDFVDERTEFASWQELQQTAEVEWMKDQV